QINHAHITEENAIPETSAERFGACFLSCKPLGVSWHGIDTRGGLFLLDWRKTALDKALLVTFHRFPDTLNIDNITAGADDHFRALSIICRICRTDFSN